jgi:hypothetical protein
VRADVAGDGRAADDAGGGVEREAGGQAGGVESGDGAMSAVIV